MREDRGRRQGCSQKSKVAWSNVIATRYKRMKERSPRNSNNSARVFKMFLAVMDHSTSIDRRPLVHSSTTGIIFNLRPSSLRSITKSWLQRWPLCSAQRLVHPFSLVPPREAPPLELSVGNFETCLSPELIEPLLVHRPPCPPQERPHSPVAVARTLRRECEHPLQQRLLPFGSCAVVALGGSV